MGNTDGVKVEAHIIKATPGPVIKADTLTQLSEQTASAMSEWISPPADLRGFKSYVIHSSILPQCISAYGANIAGFGIGIRYKSGYDDGDKEALAEYLWAEELIELLNMEMDTKEVFEHLLDARETYGISYLEVIRNPLGEVIGIDFIKDTPTIRKTVPLDPYIDIDYLYKDRVVTRPKRFCKYRQQIGAQTVYFKEIGDPRIMDKRTGEYLREGETLDLENQANEILEYAIGTEPYGEVRWLGQVLNVDGSRKAESLNNNYFENGRHTPLLIMIKGGTLTDESFDKLQEYMDGIKGEKGQHAFMILEAENADNKVDFDGEKQPDIEIKDMASVLQKDELFQDYLENNRKKVQSAFRLPDLYVGYTRDFNRATAQTAQEITEKQVFQPERRSLAWLINHKLLADYGLKYVEAYFKEPDITNPDDLAKILTITERAGGFTPNAALELTHKVMGTVSEDYADFDGNIPLQYLKSVPTSSSPDLAGLSSALTAQIQKAQAANDDAVVAIMKEVRSLLLSMQEEANA